MNCYEISLLFFGNNATAMRRKIKYEATPLTSMTEMETCLHFSGNQLALPCAIDLFVLFTCFICAADAAQPSKSIPKNNGENAPSKTGASGEATCTPPEVSVMATIIVAAPQLP